MKQPLENATDNDSVENETAPPPPLYLWDIPELPSMTIDDSRFLYSEGPEILAMHVVVTDDFSFSASSDAAYALVPVGEWNEPSCTDASSVVAGFEGSTPGNGNFPAGEFILISFGGAGTFYFSGWGESSTPDSIWLISNALVAFSEASVQGRTEGMDAAWTSENTLAVGQTSIVTAVYDSIDPITDPEFATKAGASRVAIDVDSGCVGDTWESQPNALPTLPQGVVFSWQGGPINATVDYSRDFDQGDHQFTIAAVTFTPV